MQERELPVNKFNDDQTYIFTARIEKILAHQEHKKCYVKLLSVADSNQQLICISDQLLLVFKNMASDTSIVVGNEYLIKGKTFPIPRSTNPHTFNYAQYLKHQGIHRQMYVSEDQFELVRKKQNSPFARMIIKMREAGLRVFEESFINEDHCGIIQAMVLGERGGLGDEINQAFINTGAIHVLAVSGLHVGILCLMIGSLFKFLEPVLRISKLKQGILSVMIVWLFALLTGASAAVCRAALMFTLFYISKDVLHRKVSIYNVLCGSAFILLAINPHQLFQVGFQFSFLAVLSIVFFYPYVNTIFTFKNKLLRYFYSSVSVGVAAQILVFPLSIFYFNKFANSFLLTSFFVVQFATIILLGGLLILIFNFLGLSVLNQVLLIPAVEFILEKFTLAIEFVETMPFSVSENLWLSPVQLVFIYLCTLSGMFFMKQSRLAIYFVLASFFALINCTVHEKIEKRNQKVAFLYDARDFCVDVLIGNKSFYLGSVDKKEGAFVYSKNRLAHSIDQVYSLEQKSHPFVEHRDGLLRLGNQLLAFAQTETITSIREDQAIDYLLVSNECKDLEKLNVDRLRDTEIILDGSLRFWEREKLKIFAEAKELKVYDVKLEGAKKIIF